MNQTQRTTESQRRKTITVWDGPVRLFHWALVLLLPAMWWSAEQGEFDWHIALGIVTMALVLVRLMWGFVGSATARFSNFLRGPGAVSSYLRETRSQQPVIGHNPLGGWSVMIMLLLLLSQLGLGLIAGDPDDHAVGPLNHLVSFTVSDTATELHEWLFNIIIAFVAVHVGAVLFYLLARGDNLVRPMLTGKKDVPDSTEQPALGQQARLLWCVLAAAAIAGWLYSGAPLPGN